MKTLIIAAHGSRKKESNLEIADLAGRIAEKTRESFDMVEHAFLQIAAPLLADQIDALIKKGATSVVIFPFFIGSGSHILVDIPKLVEEAKAKHEHVKIRVTRHLGKIQAIDDVILNEVAKAK